MRYAEIADKFDVSTESLHRMLRSEYPDIVRRKDPSNLGLPTYSFATIKDCIKTVESPTIITLNQRAAYIIMPIKTYEEMTCDS